MSGNDVPTPAICVDIYLNRQNPEEAGAMVRRIIHVTSTGKIPAQPVELIQGNADAAGGNPLQGQEQPDQGCDVDQGVCLNPDSYVVQEIEESLVPEEGENEEEEEVGDGEGDLDSDEVGSEEEIGKYEDDVSPDENAAYEEEDTNEVEVLEPKRQFEPEDDDTQPIKRRRKDSPETTTNGAEIELIEID